MENRIVPNNLPVGQWASCGDKKRICTKSQPVHYTDVILRITYAATIPITNATVIETSRARTPTRMVIGNDVVFTECRHIPRATKTRSAPKNPTEISVRMSADAKKSAMTIKITPAQILAAPVRAPYRYCPASPPAP